MPEIPIVVLGAGAVGKSCLTIQFIQGHFVDHYDSTIEDVYRKPVEVDGTHYVLTIVDTAGQESFSAMRETYMKTGQAFILVYSITDSESFQQLKRVYMQLKRTRGESSNITCILVGNKCDLGNLRAVASSEGEMFARQVNCPFKEVSAKNRLEVEDVFTTLVRSIARSGSDPAPAASASAPAEAHGAQQGAQHSDASRQAAPAPAPVAPKPAKPAKKKWRCVML